MLPRIGNDVFGLSVTAHSTTVKNSASARARDAAGSCMVAHGLRVGASKSLVVDAEVVAPSVVDEELVVGASVVLDDDEVVLSSGIAEHELPVQASVVDEVAGSCTVADELLDRVSVVDDEAVGSGVVEHASEMLVGASSVVVDDAVSGPSVVGDELLIGASVIVEDEVVGTAVVDHERL